MNIRISWRNLWRNPRRAAVSMSALTAGTVALIFVHALWTGFAVDLIKSVTGLGEGEVKAHAADYLGDRSIYKSIDDSQSLLEAARKNGIDAAPRSIGYGLVAKGAKSAGVQLIGADPVAERALGNLPTHISAGEFLHDRADRRVVLGVKLAKSIDAKVGDDLVLVVQAADGSTSTEIYYLGGVFAAVSEALDRSAIYMHKDDLDALFSMGGRIQEIAFNSHGRLDPDQVVALLQPSAGSAEVKTWYQLYPVLRSIVEMDLTMIMIIQAVFYLAAGLGVMNTMLMATFERIPEFGVMKALGCSPARIISEVTLEALILGIVGCIAGACIGSGLSIYFGRRGIDAGSVMGSFSAGGLVFNNIWQPVLLAKAVYGAVSFMCVVVIVATLYPAIKAARIDPAKAISHV